MGRLAAYACSVAIASAVHEEVSQSSASTTVAFRALSEVKPFAEPSRKQHGPLRRGNASHEEIASACSFGMLFHGTAQTACRGIWDERYEHLVLTQPHDNWQALWKVLMQHQCPFGHALPGSVTWPSPPEELRGIAAPLTFAKFIAVFYSYAPWLTAASTAIGFAYRRSTRELWALCWLFCTITLCEGCLKPLLRQPRPGTLLQVRDYNGFFVGSCLPSCGMPSSHSALSVGWFLLLFLDAVFRVHPYALGGKTQTMPVPPDVPALQKARKFLSFFLWVPWKGHDLLTHTEFVVYIMTWFIILMPVPFFRVVLYDHTTEQVIAGSLVGIFMALVWWRFVRYMQRRFQSLEGQHVLYGVVLHTYKLPQFHLTCAGDIAPASDDGIGLKAEQGEVRHHMLGRSGSLVSSSDE